MVQPTDQGAEQALGMPCAPLQDSGIRRPKPGARAPGQQLVKGKSNPICPNRSWAGPRGIGSNPGGRDQRAHSEVQ
jgi:hypothetical protein